MCAILRYRGEEIETYGKLKRILGENNIILAGGFDSPDDEQCLCCVDLPMTGFATEMWVRFNDADYEYRKASSRRK